MIPKIIHQSWKTKDLSTYSNGSIGFESQNSFIKHCPDFKYMFWTDARIEEEISKADSTIKDTFYTIDSNIKRMDFFRYFIVHKFGGVYADIDFILNSSIPRKIMQDMNFFGYKAHRSENNRYQEEKKHLLNEDSHGKWVLGNAFFACEGKSKKLKLVIDDICKNRLKKEFVLTFSGPEKINEVFNNFNLFDEKTKIFSRSDVGNGKNSKIGYHKMQGSWH